MKYVLLLTLLVCAAMVRAQNVDSLNTARLDSMNKADSQWLLTPMNLVDHPIIHVFDFDSLLSRIPVNASLSFESVPDYDLQYMVDLLDAYDTVVSGEVYRVKDPDNLNWTRFIMRDTVYPVSFLDEGTYKTVAFPGKTMFIISPARTFYYVFSYSKRTKQYLWYVFFRGTEKYFEVADRTYPVAGREPGMMVRMMLPFK